jgi:hypothetical protein
MLWALWRRSPDATVGTACAALLPIACWCSFYVCCRAGPGHQGRRSGSRAAAPRRRAHQPALCHCRRAHCRGWMVPRLADATVTMRSEGRDAPPQLLRDTLQRRDTMSAARLARGFPPGGPDAGHPPGGARRVVAASRHRARGAAGSSRTRYTRRTRGMPARPRRRLRGQARSPRAVGRDDSGGDGGALGAR